MPIGLMNLLRAIGRGSGVLRQSPKPAGTAPGWAQRTFDPRKNPLKEGRPWYDPKMVGPRQGIDVRTGTAGIPGRRGTFYGDSPLARGSRIALTGVGGAVAADRLVGMMRGDEVAPDDAKAMRSGILPSPSMPSMPADFESRLAFEQRKSKKMNKQMKRLLQYYGIINLVNPDSASDMLKLGTAMLEQDMGQMGTDRQAKIFDAIFKSGSMPSSGAEAAKMILNAGGTPEDVADITDIYESITPKAANLAEDERATAAYYEAKSYVDAGLDDMAEQILTASIISGQIARDSLPSGVEMPIKDQVQSIIQMMGGTPGMADNSQGIKIL